MRRLVTGATGFVGGLVPALLARGREVSALGCSLVAGLHSPVVASVLAPTPHPHDRPSAAVLA